MKYIPQSEADRHSLLQSIGMSRIDDLFAGIPESLRLKKPLPYPRAQSEMEIRRTFQNLAQLSHAPRMNFAGCGIYQHDISSIVPFLQGRSEFSTAYTPYQAEISQGLLQCIFEYQTLACQLTEMELSNASMYDGATSLGEAALMAIRLKKKTDGKILVSGALHPFYRDVLRTYCDHFLDRFVELPLNEDQLDLKKIERLIDDKVDILITQSPNVFGVIENYAAISKILSSRNVLWITSTMEPLSFGVTRGPGFYGATIATAEGQSFGNSAYLGGSTYGIFTTKNEHLRNLPGRLVGETVDEDGKRAFTLTFATREQFIRRGRATSNICTNNNLNMIAGLIQMCTLGKSGLRQVAIQNYSKTEYLKEKLQGLKKVKISSSPTFNEFTVELSREARGVVKMAAEQDFVCGVDLGRFNSEWNNKLLIHTSELHTKENMDELVRFLQGAAT